MIEKIASWVVWLICLFAVMYFGAHILAYIIMNQR